MAPRPAFKAEYLLYIAILFLALAIRVIRLGEIPLNEFEAQAALNAQHLAAGSPSMIGDQTSYIVLTSLVFSLLPSSEFLARLWPMLFGVALVAMPYFCRDLLGRKAALVLSLALALDPGFVAISRLASGRIIAMAALAIAFTLWRMKRPIGAGGFFALALISAPTVYLGLLGLALIGALFFAKDFRVDRSALRSALISGGATLLFCGLFLMRVPGGLGAIGNPLSSFLRGWTQPSGIPSLQIVFSLITYGFPAFIFAVLGAFRAWNSRIPLGQALSVGVLINLGLVLVYPAHQVADLLWVLPPLWALAAMEIARYLIVPQDEKTAAVGEASLMTLLLFFLLFALTKLGTGEATGDSGPYLILAGGVILLGALATLLVAFGWSKPAAANGLVWALAGFCMLILISDSSRFLRNDQLSANDLWAPGPAAGETALIQQSVRNLSNWNTGQPASVAVDLRLDSAELAWAFRNLPQASDEPDLPALIITLATDAQPSDDSYRGQSFAYQFQRSWSPFPPGLFSWLLYRKAPVVADQAILWASLSMFPDAASELPNSGDTN